MIWSESGVLTGVRTDAQAPTVDILATGKSSGPLVRDKSKGSGALYQGGNTYRRSRLSNQLATRSSKVGSETFPSASASSLVRLLDPQPGGNVSDPGLIRACGAVDESALKSTTIVSVTVMMNVVQL